MTTGTIPTGYIVLSFASHRARTRSGVTATPSAFAVYSFRRATTGGYYCMPREAADRMLAREMTGVSRLRGPYDDLLRCW